MKADMIIKNAKIFTSDKDDPQATALVVKDGKFIMPGIIDSHVHITTGVGFEYTDLGAYVKCSTKEESLSFMAEYVHNNPGPKGPEPVKYA